MALISILDQCLSRLQSFLTVSDNVKVKLEPFLRGVTSFRNSSLLTGDNLNDLKIVMLFIEIHHNLLIYSLPGVNQLYRNPFEAVVLYFGLFSFLYELRNPYLIRNCCVFGMPCPLNCLLSVTFTTASTSVLNFSILKSFKNILGSKQQMIESAFNKSCPVCLNTRFDANSPLVYLVMCKHVFCTECFELWIISLHGHNLPL